MVGRVIVAFDITFTSRLTTRPFENVVVEFDMGEGASGIKCLAGRETGGLGSRGGIGPMDLGSMGSMIPGTSSGASWAVDSRKRVRFGSIALALTLGHQVVERLIHILYRF